MDDMLENIRQQHLHKWLTEPIPMLNNLSPTAASKTKDGRARLEQLLDFYDTTSQNMPQGVHNGFSINPTREWAYSKLGIGPPRKGPQEAPHVHTKAMLFASGEELVLTKLDTMHLNGQSGTVIGPPHEGRVPLKMKDGSMKRVRIRNLRAYCPQQHSGYCGTNHADANLPPLPGCPSQTSVGASYDKGISYIVDRFQFERIPRWPADGCERSAAAFRSGQHELFSHHETSQKCQRQRAFERLYGGWVSSSPLSEVSEDGFLLALPYMAQEAAAAETFNARAAIDYLYEHQDSPEPAALLQSAIGKIKLGRHKDQFPGLRLLLGFLARKEMLTDRVLEILFGDAAHVRSLAMAIGELFTCPPPPGSPAHLEWSDVISGEFRMLKGYCANCGADGTEVKLQSCASCSTQRQSRIVQYCSRTCQKEHWPIHKPECLAANGQEVTSDDKARAAAKLTKRQEVFTDETNSQRTKMVAEEQAVVRRCMQAFQSGEWKRVKGHTADGAEFVADVGPKSEACLMVCGQRVGLATTTPVDHMRPLFPPRGMPSDGSGYHADDLHENVFVMQTVEGAYILLSHVRLFGSHGEGSYMGAGLTGIWYAVDQRDGHDSRHDSEVTWMKVPHPPRTAHESAYDFLCTWLRAALLRATYVTHGIYRLGTPECLGHTIHDQHICGQLFRNVGPPTSSDNTHACAQALVRPQLAAAQATLEDSPQGDDQVLLRSEAQLPSLATLKNTPKKKKKTAAALPNLPPAPPRSPAAASKSAGNSAPAAPAVPPGRAQAVAKLAAEPINTPMVMLLLTLGAQLVLVLIAFAT